MGPRRHARGELPGDHRQVRGFDRLFARLAEEFDKPPATDPLPKHQTSDVEGLLASVAEERRLQEDLPEEDGDG